MCSRPRRKRLSVDLPDQLHKDIKESADIRGITITMWVLRACNARIRSERLLQYTQIKE